MILKSVSEEASDCRKAFEGIKVGAVVLHCHHEVLSEILSEQAENRIAYILSSKSLGEQALRLRLFRPLPVEFMAKHPELVKLFAAWDKASAELSKASAELSKASAAWDKAHAERDKASAAWSKASAELSAELSKARAELSKASTAWDKASAELSKARAAWDKARAAWDKAWSKASAELSKARAAVEPHHSELCPGCPWDGRTIFPNEVD